MNKTRFNMLKLIAGSGLFLGPALTLLGYAIDGYHLTELGFPPQMLEGLGALFFFLGVGGLLYSWRVEHHSFLDSVPHAVVTKPIAALPPYNSPSQYIESKQPSGDQNDRIFMKETLDNLRKIRKSHTTIDADRLLKPYLGKWMRVTGRVHDASIKEYGRTVWLEPHDVVLDFKQKWEPHIEILKKGIRVDAIGQIDEVLFGYVSLKNCEFVENSGVPNP